MHLKISKSDLLQSVGFALNAAEHDYEQLKHRATMIVMSAVHAGEKLKDETHAEIAEAIGEAQSKLNDLGIIKRMAEFAGEAEELFLDIKSFALLETNLPAR